MVSGLRSFWRAIAGHHSVQRLYAAMSVSPNVRNGVLQRIQTLSRLDVDRRFQNPNDTALAGLLILVASTDSTLARVAADLTDRAPECFFAKAIARRILNPTLSETENSPISQLPTNRTEAVDQLEPANIPVTNDTIWTLGGLDTSTKATRTVPEV